MAEKKKGKLQQMKRLKNNKHLKIERAETTKYIFNSIHFQLSVARRLSCFLPLPSGSRHKAGHEQSLVQVETSLNILLLLCNSRYHSIILLTENICISFIIMTSDVSTQVDLPTRPLQGQQLDELVQTGGKRLALWHSSYQLEDHGGGKISRKSFLQICQI